MRQPLTLLRLLIPVAVAVWLAGCTTSPQARFYTLIPLGSPGATPPAPGSPSPVSVSVAPVEIPDYLDRPQIVTRDGRNGLKLSEFDRWGGSLAENFATVLAENLAQLLGTDRVFVYPRMQSEQTLFTVAARVLRLDAVPGEQVHLRVQWTVAAGADRKDVVTRTASYTERLSDGRYDTLAEGISRTLEQLSREIARTIGERSKGAASSPPPPGSP